MIKFFQGKISVSMISRYVIEQGEYYVLHDHPQEFAANLTVVFRQLKF